MEKCRRLAARRREAENLNGIIVGTGSAPGFPHASPEGDRGLWAEPKETLNEAHAGSGQTQSMKPEHKEPQVPRISAASAALNALLQSVSAPPNAEP